MADHGGVEPLLVSLLTTTILTHNHDDTFSRLLYRLNAVLRARAKSKASDSETYTSAVAKLLDCIRYVEGKTDGDAKNIALLNFAKSFAAFDHTLLHPLPSHCSIDAVLTEPPQDEEQTEPVRISECAPPQIRPKNVIMAIRPIPPYKPPIASDPLPILNVPSIVPKVTPNLLESPPVPSDMPVSVVPPSLPALPANISSSSVPVPPSRSTRFIPVPQAALSFSYSGFGALSRDYELYNTDELDRIICSSFDENKITEERQKELKRVKSRLNNPLQGAVRRNIILEPFGSTVNGFGTNRSDLDLCFRYRDERGDEREDRQKYTTIYYIKNALHDAGFDDVTSITSRVKVPIVKFTKQMDSGTIEGDISYYNELALHNTRLLKRYCTWTKDDMLSKLGLFVKRWAKECDIANASQGSLSSYAWIILLIHFLQRVEPYPLLPVLQEMGDCTEVLVDDWDVSFCDDEPTPDWSRCTLSVGELFLQFLDYYSKFNWAEEVVQISESATALQVDRVNMTLMYIEDPFKFDHNLSSRIGDQMFAFIKNAFVTSRDIFSGGCERRIFTQDEIKNGYDVSSEHPIPDESIPYYGDALLAKCKSSIGEAPNEQRCRKCGVVGHLSDTCLTKKGGKTHK